MSVHVEIGIAHLDTDSHMEHLRCARQVASSENGSSINIYNFHPKLSVGKNSVPYDQSNCHDTNIEYPDSDMELSSGFESSNSGLDSSISGHDSSLNLSKEVCS